LPLDAKAAQPANSGQPRAAGRASEMQTEPESASIEPDDAATQELATEFLTNPAAHLAALRDLLKEILETVDENERQEMVVDLYLRMHSLALKADLPELRAAFQLSSALEGLLKKLLEKPANSTPSTLHTIAVGVDLLHDLCLAGVQADLATNPPIRILVVDDDPLARRAISGALQTTFKKPHSADSGQAALALATEKPFDVIFLDVQMPGLDGFTVCTRIHETIANSDTPVIFVTTSSVLKSRAEATRAGGSDLIAKPYLPIEITVKALTFALRGRLQKLKSGVPPSEPSLPVTPVKEPACVA